MLITTCTHCLARFRVTPQQLNAKQGQVRCGRCTKVFSGFEALERFPDDDTGARLLAAREAEQSVPPSGPPPESLPEVQSVDDPPVPAPVPAPAPAPPRARVAPAYVEAPAAPSTPHRPMPRPLPRLEYEETDPVPERRSWGWSVGVVLLAGVLAAQGAYAFRAEIAQRYPAARPWLVKACTKIGCKVDWPRNEQLLKLEDSELLEVPGHAGEISVSARVRNLAPFAQEYPFIELTLTDTTGQPTARRVLRPVDYLGHAPSADEAFAAGGELALQLRLATPNLRPTGYQLLLFYP